MSYQSSRRQARWAIGLSVLFHLILFVILFHAWYTSRHSGFETPEFAGKKEPGVVFVPAPPAGASSQATQATQTQAAIAAPTEESIAESTQPHDYEQPQEEINSEARMSVPTATTPHRWSSERARRAWIRSELHTQSSESDPQEKSRLETIKKMGTIFSSSSNFHAGNGNGTGSGSGQSLTERVNAGWKQATAENFQGAIAQAICYELNKQQIAEAPANLPEELVIRLKVARSGALLDVRLLRASGSTHFNEQILYAVKAAAPFRPLPAFWNQDECVITFTIVPTQLNNRTSHRKVPITFFLQKPR